jgi:hypothetical protein
VTTPRRPEVLLFTAMAAFGLIVGTVYWFVSYEWAGTVLLIAFGIASAVGALILAWRSRASGDAVGEPAAEHEESQLAGWGPIIGGLGLSVIVLGLIFGPVLVIPGLIIAIAGGRTWLAAVDRPSDR